MLFLPKHTKLKKHKTTATLTKPPQAKMVSTLHHSGLSRLLMTSHGYHLHGC